MLGQLFQQPENEVVTAAIEKLRTKISGKFDTEVLLHELETMAKENTIDHWTFMTSNAMTGVSIMCLFILFCCWRVCCWSRPASATNAAHSAPPPQPTILNMTVDPIRRWRFLETHEDSFIFVYRLYFLSVNPPKQWERYTITNILQLSIYILLQIRLVSNLECLHSKTFETPCLMFLDKCLCFSLIKIEPVSINPSQATHTSFFFSVVYSLLLKMLSLVVIKN